MNERFWSKVDAAGDCWLWTRARDSAGYGRFWSTERGNNVYAHRWAWEEMVGAVPAGMELDHLCRNKACVNPDHLEPVPGAVNRGRSPLSSAGRSHCRHGHELAGDNLKIDPAGWRQCRACNLEKSRRHEARRARRVR